MNYASIKPVDIANGLGCRVSLFVSGCPHQCKGCFNKETWDSGYGEEFTKEIEKKIIRLLSPHYIKGLSLLGGEPLTIPHLLSLGHLLETVKNTYPDKDIWCYTGYLYDDVIKMANTCPHYQDIVSKIDVLVDGPFIEELKVPNLRFRGSTNQNIIDFKKSLIENKMILHETMTEEI